MTKPCKRNAVVIFSKAPIAGEVKTRLAKNLGEKNALLVYKAMLRVICKILSSQGQWDCYLSASKELDHPFFRELMDEFDLKTHLQIEGDLGAKMKTAMDDLLGAYDQVAIVGGDAISITSESLETCFDGLSNNDVALVPAEDGGYISIVAKKTDPSMFSDIEWGTEKVLEQQLARFSQMGWDTWLNSRLWDLDELDDFKRVKTMPELYQSMLDAGLSKNI
ncbi:TIGR04282 family arsenosugar biosynthesis glycosyltransferase [Litoribrevibacter euphylliae]|uniref:TIGR04282 family arsenosugar biosynthesis glycosyltransferase n=1 Tax=Litoribrevibacter euphylliae TaxID=1834034 RepID=A0ABV7HBU5_9GAMM